MWLLVATLCIMTAPGRAECRVDVTRIERDEISCVEMTWPTEDLLSDLAAGVGMDVLYLATACERGPVI